MSGMIFISPVIIHIYTIADHIISSGWGYFLKHQITRASNHFLCISPLLFTVALLFVFAFLPVYRGRGEEEVWRFHRGPLLRRWCLCRWWKQTKERSLSLSLGGENIRADFSSSVLYKQRRKEALWFCLSPMYVYNIEHSYHLKLLFIR